MSPRNAYAYRPQPIAPVMVGAYVLALPHRPVADIARDLDALASAPGPDARAMRLAASREVIRREA